jgi:putative transposase
MGVEPICAVLSEHGVTIAPSTYYEWLAQTPSPRQTRDEYLMGEIIVAYEASHRIYGARKVWIRLNRRGVPVARCTVERLMRKADLKGVTRQVRKRTTVPDPSRPTPDDLVNRQFDPSAPDQLWVADITYVSTWSGWAYVAFVMDCFARRIVGWAVAASMSTSLVIGALDQAIWTRQLEGHDQFDRLIAHLDHGSQYTSIRYGQRLAAAGITPSAGTVKDSYDNAAAESLNGVFKAEMVWHAGPWRTIGQVEYETGCWVDWYNNQRIHEYDGYLSPIEYEARYYLSMTVEI